MLTFTKIIVVCNEPIIKQFICRASVLKQRIQSETHPDETTYMRKCVCISLFTSEWSIPSHNTLAYYRGTTTISRSQLRAAAMESHSFLFFNVPRFGDLLIAMKLREFVSDMKHKSNTPLETPLHFEIVIRSNFLNRWWRNAVSRTSSERPWQLLRTITLIFGDINRETSSSCPK